MHPRPARRGWLRKTRETHLRSERGPCSSSGRIEYALQVTLIRGARASEADSRDVSGPPPDPTGSAALGRDPTSSNTAECA